MEIVINWQLWAMRKTTMTLNVISLLTCSQTYEQTSIIMYPMYQRHFMVLHATYHLLKIICIRVDSHGSRNVQTGQTCSNLSTQTVWSCKVSVQSVNRISGLPTPKKVSWLPKKLESPTPVSTNLPFHKYPTSAKHPPLRIGRKPTFNVHTKQFLGHAGCLIEVWKVQFNRLHLFTSSNFAQI